MRRAGAVLFLVMAAAAPGWAQGDPQKGKALYVRSCAACHGETGKGNGPAAVALPVKPRDHTDGKYMNQLSDEDLKKIILAGGAAVGKSPLMPAWKATLKGDEIEQLIAYLRSIAQPPHKRP